MGGRLPALIAVLALLAVACGARLSDEERQLAIAGVGDGDGPAGQPRAPGGPATPGPSIGPSPGATGPAVGPDGGATDAPGGPGSGGDGGAGDGTGGGGGAGRDTRAAPPGGNGGATDVGVTETEIVVMNAVDRSGAVPGLFQDAQQAVQAYVQYFASTEGTVYGRGIRLITRDTALSTQENRSAYLDACQNAFAAVGSMSAFEQGAADPIESCGIPDLRTAAVNDQMQRLPSVVSVDAMKPGLVPLAEYEYWKEQHPDAITQAGYLWIDADTTEYQTEQNRAATERIGYRWVYAKPIGLSEVNYASYVSEMKSAGVQFVTFQGAYQQAARLAKAMQQQGMAPAVFALQSNTYTPGLISESGSAGEQMIEVAQTGALLEEMDANEEMQLYAQWLQRLFPDARPTGLGLYAWAAARLFVDALKEVGPELTREVLLDHLDGVQGFDANGLIPPQDIGGQVPTDCIVIVGIEGGRFVRVEPSGVGRYRCRPSPGSV